jgi:hypothetical protein
MLLKDYGHKGSAEKKKESVVVILNELDTKKN